MVTTEASNDSIGKLRVAGPRRVIKRLSVSIALLSLISIAIVRPAYATSCAGGGDHFYAGQMNGLYNHNGAEGTISEGTHTLNSATFDIDWTGLFGQTGCDYGPLDGVCSIQAGNGLGNVGGYSSNGIQGYMEEGDLNGYAVNWTANSCISPQVYVSVFYTGATGSGGSAQMYAVLTGACGQNLVGVAYFPTTGSEYETTSEVYNDNSGTCANTQTTYFGANVAGSASTGTILQGSYDGKTWHPASSQTVFTNAPYDYNSIISPTAFGTSGS